MLLFGLCFGAMYPLSEQLQKLLFWNNFGTQCSLAMNQSGTPLSVSSVDRRKAGEIFSTHEVVG